MTRILVALALVAAALLAQPAPALASCRTVTIMEDGRMKICTVCTLGMSTTINCY